MGVVVEDHKQNQGTPSCPGISRHRLDGGSPRQPHTSVQAEELLSQYVESHKWKLESEDIKTAFLSRAPQHPHPAPR